jgi:Fe2+ or Zn2+ uptake regulation protein
MTSLVTEAKQLLASRGGRMTPQRRMILDALEANQVEHPTAEELYQILQPDAPELNLSTVYRTLRWLEEAGLVGSCWFETDRGQERFDLALTSEHHHFVCRQCQRVIEFQAPEMEAIKTKFQRDFGCLVEVSSIALTGLCEDCRIEPDNGDS